MDHHPLKRDNPPPPQWPSFTGTAQFVGASASGQVNVYLDPTLGQPGLQNALDLVNDADRVVAANNAFFGIAGAPLTVIIFALNGATDGTGGADHMGCNFSQDTASGGGGAIEVCAAFGSPDRVSALFEAELSECAMNGSLCGFSTGEALSRWCSAVVGRNALADFATAPTWFQNGTPDYVSETDPTDQNPISTGCGMAFLSWLLSQGFGLDRIAQGMVLLGDSGTLAQLYEKLTGSPASGAFGAFMAAVNGLAGGVTSDDPFGGAPPSPRLAQLNPGTIALALKILGVILTDIAAHKTVAQIVSDVLAALGAATKPATGPRKSRRLLPPEMSEQ